MSVFIAKLHTVRVGDLLGLFVGLEVTGDFDGGVEVGCEK